MNEIWKTEVEVPSILCTERAHRGLFSDEMCLNGGVRLEFGRGSHTKLLNGPGCQGPFG